MDPIEALGLPPARWIDLDGPVHHREWEGPADGPVFVLVHGLGGSLLNWVPVAPSLSERGRVLALDLAGFGMTPLAERSADVRANRRLLNAFIRAMDLPPVVLVGNSMGGMISLLQAAHVPESVRALVLVDAAFPRGSLRTARPNLQVSALFASYAAGSVGERLAERRARRLGAEGLVRETLRVSTANPGAIDQALRAAMVEQVERRMATGHAMPAFMEAARTIFWSQAAPARYRELVRRVRTPALVVHGAEDRLVPVQVAEEIAAAHDTWELRVLPGIGHVPQLEDPRGWLAVVSDWLERSGLVPRAAAG